MKKFSWELIRNDLELANKQLDREAIKAFSMRAIGMLLFNQALDAAEEKYKNKNNKGFGGGF